MKSLLNPPERGAGPKRDNKWQFTINAEEEVKMINQGTFLKNNGFVWEFMGTLECFM